MGEDCRTEADRGNHFATAFTTVSEVCRLLTQALEKGQRFTVTVSAGDHEDPPVRGADGKLWATGHLNGSYDIKIHIDPPAICPKCGKNHNVSVVV